MLLVLLTSCFLTAAALSPAASAPLPFELELKWANAAPQDFVRHITVADDPAEREASLAALTESVAARPGALSERECDALRALLKGDKEQVALRGEIAKTPSFERLAELKKQFSEEATLTTATIRRLVAPRNFQRSDATVCVDVALSPGNLHCLVEGECRVISRESGDATVYSGATVVGAQPHCSLVLIYHTEEDRDRSILRRQQQQTDTVKGPDRRYRQRKQKAQSPQWLTREQTRKSLFDPVDDDDDDDK